MIRIQDTDARQGATETPDAKSQALVRARAYAAAPWLRDGSMPSSMPSSMPQVRARIPGIGARPLASRAAHPVGWHDILRQADAVQAPNLFAPGPLRDQAWVDDAALRLASHFVACSTHAPSPWEPELSARLWSCVDEDAALDAMVELVLALRTWELAGVSARILKCGPYGTISEHDGERLGILAAGYVRLLARGDTSRAGRLCAEIEDELQREARLFGWLSRQPHRELDLLQVAGCLVHTAIRLDQGLSHVDPRHEKGAHRQSWAGLCGEGFRQFGGIFGQAAALHETRLACETHGYTSLRSMERLREDAKWLMPTAPFLDGWGRALAADADFDEEARAWVVSGLLHAHRETPGQAGCARALAGLGAPLAPARRGRVLERYRPYLGASARRILKDGDLRRRIAVPQAAFEARYTEHVRLVMARYGL